MGAKKEDHFFLWIVSGIGGVLVRDGFNLIMKGVGLAKHYVWNIGADIFVEPAVVQTFWGTVLGFAADFVVGGLLGVLLGLFIEWRGPRYYWLKGLGIGLLAWLFFYGIIFHVLPLTEKTAPKDVLSNLSAFIDHAIFGLTAAIIYMKLAKATKSGWK